MKEAYNLRYLEPVGWRVQESSIGYEVLNEEDEFFFVIKTAQGKNSKQEVVAFSVQKTEREFKKRSWQWPSQKKLKNI